MVTTLKAKTITFFHKFNTNHLSIEDKARLLMRNYQRNIKARQEAMLVRAAADEKAAIAYLESTYKIIKSLT